MTRIRSGSERAIRQRAACAGYLVSRSRDRALQSNNAGLFHLCDDRNNVILGNGLSATLDNFAEYLAAVAQVSGLQSKGTV